LGGVGLSRMSEFIQEGLSSSFLAAFGALNNPFLSLAHFSRQPKGFWQTGQTLLARVDGILPPKTLV
jgi:hypothetical protein